MSRCPGIERLILSRVFPRCFAIGSLGTSSFLEMAGKPSRTIFGETSLGCCIGEVHPSLECLLSFFFFFSFFLFFFLKVSALVCLTLSPHISLFLATKARPKLKSRYKNRVKSVVDYTKTIEDFDKLIVPRTLAHHFLGPEPSLYVLRTTAIE